jgi:surfactin family lipopeptide synthetase A
MDGISLEILIKNLILKYNENLELKSLKNIQFKDYSEWENKAVKEECLENKLFWNTYLANYVPKSSFIGDLNKINKYQGRRYYFEFSNKISFDIKKLATNQSTTPYVILLSAMNFLINKISGHLDTCIGILDSGRSHFQVENCLGLFIKTLVLRTKLIPDQKFSILIKTIESDLLEIERHKNVRYDIIPNSVINLLFVYQNPDFSFETIDGIRGVTIENIPINEVYSKFPMIFNIFEDGNCIKGYIEYNTSFYSNRLIKFISSMFSIVIQEIINGVKDLDKIELDKFETLTEAELDFDFNF